MTRRLVLAIIAALLVGFAAGLMMGVRGATPRPAQQSGTPGRSQVWPGSERTGVPQNVGANGSGESATPVQDRTPGATPSSPATHGKRPASVGDTQPAAKPPVAAKRSLTGTASWGCCWSGVVTRLPRGTRICVTGPLGRWCGRSVGYGPAVWTGRIADLSRAVFVTICGPLSRGLCTVTVRA